MLVGTLALVLSLVQCSSATNEGAQPTDPNPGTGPPTTPPPPTTGSVEVWLTGPDQGSLLEKQGTALAFGSATNPYPTIELDAEQHFQRVDGFGFTLTGGSAQVLGQLPDAKRAELLGELFGRGPGDISISYLRISIGASDLNAEPFTYDDMPEGQTDVALANFNMEKDRQVLTILKEILTIDPGIKIMASPWSPPVWMKDNGSFVGGSLQPQYYGTYAQYFVKYLQAMATEGIPVDAVTIQNEPLHGGNNPSLLMSALEQAVFIGDHLGPAFEAADLSTKIVIWDHNCDNPQYPITVLSDSQAYPYIDGSAFHLYNGDISALSTVHNSFPEKNLYFTEQYTASNGSFAGDLRWHIKNVIIGSMRNWSKNALEWNLANDPNFGPHTDGGCTVCKGGLTISPEGNIERNVGYYIVAHASKFVPRESLRIASNLTGNLHNVAFRTPEGRIVLLVLNDGDHAESFNIKYDNRWATAHLGAGSVATYVWKP